MSIQFPNPYNNGRGQTPIIGEQQVPIMRFDVQVSPSLLDAIQEFTEEAGLDGPSLLNYVINRGITAIKQDLQYAQEERDALRQDRPPEELGA